MVLLVDNGKRRGITLVCTRVDVDVAVSAKVLLIHNHERLTADFGSRHDFEDHDNLMVHAISPTNKSKTLNPIAINIE